MSDSPFERRAKWKRMAHNNATCSNTEIDQNCWKKLVDSAGSNGWLFDVARKKFEKKSIAERAEDIMKSALAYPYRASATPLVMMITSAITGTTRRRRNATKSVRKSRVDSGGLAANLREMK